MREKPDSSQLHDVRELEDGLRRIARYKVERALDAQCVVPQLCNSTLVERLVDQALKLARERLFPHLMWMRAAHLDPRSAERLIEGGAFQAASVRWEEVVERDISVIIDQISHFQKSSWCLISRIDVLDGDPHNGGKRPLKVTVASESGDLDYVFKSVDPTAMLMVHKISEVVCKSLGIPVFIDKPEFFGDCSYVRKFAASGSPENHHLSGYFYAFGVLCSVASLLEVTDLHFENIIATAAGPKIIDLEFVLSNTQYQDGKWSYKSSGLFEYGTSPIGQIKRHQHISPSYLVREGRFFYRHLEGRESDQHVICGPGGTLVDVKKHAGEISAGFRDADFLLRRLAGEIPGMLSEFVCRDHKLRCWIRGTAYYRILQLQIWLPGASFDDRLAVVRRKLSNVKTISSKIDRETRLKIIEAELMDLVAGDIPYFWVDGTNGNLMHSTGMLKERFCMPTALAVQKCTASRVTRVSMRKLDKIMSRMSGQH